MLAARAFSHLTWRRGHARRQKNGFKDMIPMNRSTFPVCLVALFCFGLANPSFSQDATTEAPAVDAQVEAPVLPGAEGAAPVEGAPAEGAAPADLSMGQPVDSTGAAPTDGPGSVYVASTHDSWELRCLRAEDGSDPCQLYQLLKDQDGNSVAEMTMFPLPPGKPAVAGATFAAPLETLLTEALRIQVDGNTAKVYPFSWCAQDGCVARLGLTAEEIASFKAGNAATATIVPVVAPDQKVILTISLKGFTAGYDALVASVAAAPAVPPAPAP
jgi:invasion protein IalB